MTALKAPSTGWLRRVAALRVETSTTRHSPHPERLVHELHRPPPNRPGCWRPVDRRRRRRRPRLVGTVHRRRHQHRQLVRGRHRRHRHRRRHGRLQPHRPGPALGALRLDRRVERRQPPAPLRHVVEDQRHQGPRRPAAPEGRCHREGRHLRRDRREVDRSSTVRCRPPPSATRPRARTPATASSTPPAPRASASRSPCPTATGDNAFQGGTASTTFSFDAEQTLNN